SYTSNRVHIVFSTKDRREQITSDSKLREYIEDIANNLHVPLFEVGGTGNHVHILMEVPAFMTLAKVVQTIKANTSRFLKESVPDFAWQEGYGAFSVSASGIESVREYIKSQPEHHTKHTFEDEFRSLLVRHGIHFDEKYVFG
ncbi:MAG TPA: IS200/IS605 family transposase, partial [Terriglobales bacterium]|nr:IS200/IS605 family transposase [Terriglobales bacterium]